MARMHRQPKKSVLILFAIGLILLVLIMAVLWRAAWFSPGDSLLSVGQPGSASGSAGHYQHSSEAIELLRQRMIKLLNQETGGLANWYRLAGKFGVPESVRSTEFLASDQLRYGQYLLEQRKLQDFQIWWQNFRLTYLSPAGLVRPAARVTDDNIRLEADFWRTNISAARLLAQSCSVWPDRKRRSDLNNLSQQLLALADKALSADYTATVPTPAAVLDPAATPTPKPANTPAAVEIPKLDVLRLASLDLFAMQQLAPLDDRWRSLYERCLPIVQNGYLNDSLPLYALAYVEGQGGYLNYNGGNSSLDTEESLLVMLHLCESGQDISRSLNWIRDQLYNQHALYSSYHIIQGQATSSQECLAGYAMVARMARIIGDENLYQAAANRLLWHQATSLSSEALSAIFREDASGLVIIMAADNTWALTALR